MATLVSTGQITIVDNNDARPITAFIAANPGSTQIYTKDESSVIFTPDWTAANTNTGVEYRVRIYAGKTSASEDVTRAISGKRWSYDLTTAIVAGAANATYWNESAASGIGSIALVDDDTNGVRIRVRANLKPGLAPLTLYFDGDYLDPITGLASRVVCSIVLTQIRTGTNAVFIQINTPDGDVLEPNKPTAPVSSVRIFADLVRAGGIDNTGVTYKWYESPHGAANQIDYNLASVAIKYGLLDTLAVGANRNAAIGQIATTAGVTTAAIAVGNVPDGAFGDYKGLVVGDKAVADIGVFRVEAKDSDGVIYQSYFTVTDVSDPYDVKLISTGGDKLQNGAGSTDIYPTVYYGDEKVTNLTSWTFDWLFYAVDVLGNAIRGAFVNQTKTALLGGRLIGSNTATTFTYGGAAIAFVAGDILKVIKNGDAELFEVLSSTGNVVTVRSPTANVWIPAANFTGLTVDEFKDGFLFAMSASLTTNGANANDAAAKITIYGDDIDGKGSVTCSANRP